MADRAAPDYKPVVAPERIGPVTTGHGDAPSVRALHRQSAALNGSARVGSLSALGTHLSARAAPRTQNAVAQLAGLAQSRALFLARQAARPPQSPRIQALLNGLAPGGGAAPAPLANQPAAPVAPPPLVAAAPLANLPVAPAALPPAPLIAAAAPGNQPAAPAALPPLVAAAPLGIQPAAPLPAPVLGANQPVASNALPPAPRPIAAASTAAALSPPAHGSAAGDSAPASASAPGRAAAASSSSAASPSKFVNDGAFRASLSLSPDQESDFEDDDKGSLEANILCFLSHAERERLQDSTLFTTEQAHGLARTAATVAEYYPPAAWSYIGLGRSPVLVLEYLKHVFSARTFEVPLGSLTEFDTDAISGSKENQDTLRGSIETTFTWEANKNYVVLDYSESGASLQKACDIFGLLYPGTVFAAMPLSLNARGYESPDSPGNKFHEMVEKDPAIKAFVSRLRLMIGKAAFSSFKSHDVADAIKGAAPEPVPGAAENRRALIAEVASLVGRSAAGEAAGAAPRPTPQS